MALRIHPPRGELKFWSFLWLLFGVLGSVYFAIAGVSAALVITVPVGFLTLGIWLRIKLCGHLLFGFLVLACLLAIPLIFRGGGFDWYRLFRICLSGYFAFLVFRWIREFDDYDEEPGNA